MSAIKVELYDPRLERTGTVTRHAASRSFVKAGAVRTDDHNAFNMAAEAAVVDGPYEALLHGAAIDTIRDQVGRY
jgi:hypothetical protein